MVNYLFFLFKGFYVDRSVEAFPWNPHSVCSSEKTLFWRHRVPGASLRSYYKASPVRWRKQAHRTRQETKQIKHWSDKHGEDHLPACVGAEARKRQRSGQDHFTTTLREFAHFICIYFILLHLCSILRMLCTVFLGKKNRNDVITSGLNCNCFSLI